MEVMATSARFFKGDLFLVNDGHPDHYLFNLKLETKPSSEQFNCSIRPESDDAVRIPHPSCPGSQPQIHRFLSFGFRLCNRLSFLYSGVDRLHFGGVPYLDDEIVHVYRYYPSFSQFKKGLPLRVRTSAAVAQLPIRTEAVPADYFNL